MPTTANSPPATRAPAGCVAVAAAGAAPPAAVAATGRGSATGWSPRQQQAAEAAVSAALDRFRQALLTAARTGHHGQIGLRVALVGHQVTEFTIETADRTVLK